MTKKKKILLYVVLPTAGVAGLLIFLSFRKKKAAEETLKKPPLPEPDLIKSAASASASGFPLKKGSKGETVKKLQLLLGVEADGIFGPKTEAALKALSGSTTVNTAADFNALAQKKSDLQNQSAAFARAQQLYNEFKSGDMRILVQNTGIIYEYKEDSFGALNYTGKTLQINKGYTLGSNYTIIGTTKGGNVEIQVTGTNAGTYVVNPNVISVTTA